MARIQWDQIGTRRYENGIDRGVMYRPDGTAIPWSGLTSVEDKVEHGSSPVYYEGRKIAAGVTAGDFAATLSAITYPEELDEYQGGMRVRAGAIVNEQPPRPFSLTYRTMVNNDIANGPISYKIHIVWNVIAVPSQRVHSTISDAADAMEFQWDLVAVATELPGANPASSITIDSSELDPVILEQIEGALYGTDESEPNLPSMLEAYLLLHDWHHLSIIDHGDGTWSAVEGVPGFITLDGDIFTITGADATMIDADSYTITDTD